ncbi:MAG: hypothetical protein NTX55_01040 [Candidatus Parcubacteria bacterium]|nr:hypothetical protein [Candidatus Parcubacteria bacterium]
MVGMNIMEPEKIQKIINKTGSVALTLGENPKEQDVLTREVLRIFFQNKGWITYLFPENPEDIKNKWSPLLNNHKNPSLSSEISVRLPNNIFDVKEIRYEEEDEFLTLKILTDGNNAKKNDILLDVKPLIFDVLICIGSPDAKLDNFKDKIILTADDKTLSEKIFEITGDEISADLLFASLLLETNNFKNKVTEGSLNLAHRLLSLGADKKFIDEVIKKDYSLSFAQILGRTLARTRLNKSFQSNWAFISKNDFEKAGIENADTSLIRRIINEIKEIIPRQPAFVILWEDRENNVWALLTTEKKNENEREITGPYKSFSEAELKIQQTLKEIV